MAGALMLTGWLKLLKLITVSVVDEALVGCVVAVAVALPPVFNASFSSSLCV